MDRVDTAPRPRIRSGPATGRVRIARGRRRPRRDVGLRAARPARTQGPLVDRGASRIDRDERIPVADRSPARLRVGARRGPRPARRDDRPGHVDEHRARHRTHPSAARREPRLDDVRDGPGHRSQHRRGRSAHAHRRVRGGRPSPLLASRHRHGRPREGGVVMRRVLVTAAATVALTLAGTATAWAHANLASSDPANGATLATAPSAIRLTFTEPPDPTLSTIIVLNAGATKLATGDPTLQPPRTLSVSMPANVPDGVYTVSWRTVSTVDGHVTAGAFAFGVGATTGP